MKKIRKNTDKEVTQEIILPKSYYGDDFENSQINKSNKVSITKNQILITTITLCTTIFIILIITIVSTFTLDVKVQNETKQTTVVTNIPSTIPNISSNNEYVPTTKPNTTIEVSTVLPTTQETTISESTEQITTNQIQTEPIEETTIEKTEESNSQDFTQDKYLSVLDISVSKSNNNMLIAKITGNFTGYSSEELLNKVNVLTSTGTPYISLPNIENNNYFTFNLNLDECTGELHINLDTYNFYQSIESFYN